MKLASCAVCGLRLQKETVQIRFLPIITLWSVGKLSVTDVLLDGFCIGWCWTLDLDTAFYIEICIFEQIILLLKVGDRW